MIKVEMVTASSEVISNFDTLHMDFYVHRGYVECYNETETLNAVVMVGQRG